MMRFGQRRTATTVKSLDETIQPVNLTFKGWFEYFKHSSKSTMPKVDAWVGMRIRSILRKRQGLGYGRDHQLWQDAFFVKHGLCSSNRSSHQSSQSLEKVAHQLDSRMRKIRQCGSE